MEIVTLNIGLVIPRLGARVRAIGVPAISRGNVLSVSAAERNSAAERSRRVPVLTIRAFK